MVLIFHSFKGFSDLDLDMQVFQIWKTSGLEDFRKSYDGILIPCLPFIIDLSVLTTSRKSYDGVFIHIKWSLSLSLLRNDL
ncbi:hypothetical protein YC2023_077434 [Brassica napus]